jgi:hypothetical protein
MEAREVTELKDSILLYLFDREMERISLSEIYFDLKPENITKDVIQNYVEDLVLERLIASDPNPEGKKKYYITELGIVRLRKRGYTKLLK